MLDEIERQLDEAMQNGEIDQRRLHAVGWVIVLIGVVAAVFLLCAV